jgi:hypothetical protein
MTDVAYLCHNCGSVHEVESIRENLILDLRAAASYELSAQRGLLDPRSRFLRWRMTRGLAQALWPEYSHHRRGTWSRRLVRGPSAPVSARPIIAGQQLTTAMRARMAPSNGASGRVAANGGRVPSNGGRTSTPLSRQDHDQPA